jgi:Beta-lactamase
MSPAVIAARLEKDVAASVIPGATIVIGGHERVIFERTMGFRDVADGDPLRADAIWRVYSMTKPLVTAAPMALIEAGLLRCDQAVAEFIPSFARLRVADGKARGVPARTLPTIQDLMRHTASCHAAISAAAGHTKPILRMDFRKRICPTPRSSTGWQRCRSSISRGLSDTIVTRPTCSAGPGSHLRSQPGAGLAGHLVAGNGSLDGTRILSPATVAYMTADHLGHSIRKGATIHLGRAMGSG